MKLSEQVKTLERENERLRNLVDRQQEYIDAADYYILLTAPSIEKYKSKDLELAPEYIKELSRAYRKIPGREERPIETP